MYIYICFIVNTPGGNICLEVAYFQYAWARVHGMSRSPAFSPRFRALRGQPPPYPLVSMGVGRKERQDIKLADSRR